MSIAYHVGLRVLNITKSWRCSRTVQSTANGAQDLCTTATTRLKGLRDVKPALENSESSNHVVPSLHANPHLVSDIAMGKDVVTVPLCAVTSATNRPS